MDLRGYYGKIREITAAIEEPFPIIVSLETPDGGKPGTLTETTRALAAKSVVEGSARLATPAETANFREAQAEATRIAAQQAAAAKLQLTVVSAAELSRLTQTGERSAE